ncbi:HTH-type transcriptional activator Btr [Paenibacillus konkukensis]|uniref:HTH-type transcriptional activator Btr n=1 Tax=Paenibacillus konkukensis TaxID=2020716 RepID=A0ABY4RG52_9BACL|nr:helix-turn-helix domain-containing protein [Paenibacillus konkukensis]UQZ81456.1 HTH-type transcriptional activator Btr [Paenibacillus konkukensis]
MNPMFNITELQTICRLFYAAVGLPVHYLHPAEGVSFHYPDQQTLQFPGGRDDGEALLGAAKPTDKPAMLTLNGIEYYATLPHEPDGGLFVLGPVTFREATDDIISGLLNDYNQSFKNRGEWMRHFQTVPLMRKEQLQHACQLFYYVLYKIELRPEHIADVSWSEDGGAKVSDNVDLALIHQRDKLLLHPDLQYERTLMQLIREGQTEQLRKQIAAHPQQPAVLAKKSLVRNAKNFSICSVTLATRAAIDGGLNSEVARTMSDIYIQQIEELTTVTEVIKKRNEMFAEFAGRVKQVREASYSKTVLTCINYIFNHLYEDITLAGLAGMAGLHPNYLSQLFKKELGLSVSEYIQKEKIEEAKKLLRLSSLTLAEICSRLNFNDQSYFTKVFKKYAHATPKQYRSRLSPES